MKRINSAASYQPFSFELTMLAFFPSVRNAFCPARTLTCTARVLRARFTRHGRLAFLLCLALGLCLSFSVPAQADVVIQRGDKSMHLHDDGSFTTKRRTDEADEAHTSGSTDNQPLTRGENTSVPSKERKEETPEPLPYGVVPEVHVPWIPGYRPPGP